MKKVILVLMILFTTLSMRGQQPHDLNTLAKQEIKIVSDTMGCRMMVDGKPFFLKGMNWDYFPIGTNYSYSLWRQPDDVIKAALDKEMLLLSEMGVNVIRQYSSIPPCWVQYIYEKYGIYTMINHSFGRYGLIVNGIDYNNTEYCQKDVKEELLKEVCKLANTYKDTPGVIMYLLGNENNYGLFWKGAETEDIPIADRHSVKEARCMYELFNEATLSIKAIDPSRPVAICNGDLMFLDIIAEVCKDIDIFGVNSYRGDSFDFLFKDVKEKYGKPVLFTEFGADALNAITNQEAQREQAEILLNNWQEIYLNAA
jgi:beta-galactosidase/beta-glucuronidase